MVKETKVGIAVTIGVAMTMVLIFMIGGLHIFERGYNIYVFFNNLGDLKPRASVRMAGVEIGRVKSIDLVEGMARIKVWIKKGVRIPSRSTVTINTTGIVGETYVDISSEGGGPYLKDGDKIRGVDPVGIGTIMMKGEELSKEMVEAMSSLNLLLSAQETRKALYGILKNTENLTERINLIVKSNTDNISSIVKGVRRSVENLEKSLSLLSSDLDRMRNEIALRSEEMKEGISEARKSISDIGDRTGRIIESWERISKDMEAVAQGLRESTGSVGERLDEFSGSAKDLLKPMDRAVDGIAVASENIKAFSENILELSRSIQGQDEEIKKTISDLRTAVSDLRRSSESLRSMAESVGNKEGLLGALIFDKELADDFRTLIRDIKKKPWRLLWRD